MSKIRLHGSSSGYTEIAPVAASGNNTLTLPDSGTIVSHDANGVVGVTSVVTDTIKVGSAVTIGESGVNVVGVVTASSGIVGLTSTGMPAGSILQVVNTTNTSYASVDTTKNQYVGSLSVNATITPTSTSSKIYVIYDIVLSAEVDARELTLTPTKTVSGTTSVLNRIGDTGGSRTRVGVSQMSTSKHSACTLSMTILDSPSTTSAVTYGFYHTVQHGGGWIVRNASFTDSNNSDYSRYASTVTAMEVAV